MLRTLSCTLLCLFLAATAPAGTRPENPPRTERSAAGPDGMLPAMELPRADSIPLEAGTLGCDRTADSLPFLRPRYLRPGDTIAVVSPAGRMARKCDTAKIRRRLESWGLHVKFGEHYADRTRPYFAGSDAERAADLQRAIDDRSVRAILAFRGGYGSVRLLPLLDLTPLREDPKWIAGFSDITTLHLALRRLGVESIHGQMPAAFRFGDDAEEEAPSSESLRQALFGELERIDLPPHPYNIPGEASGRLAGGNLAVICAAAGTPEELRTDTPTVLFIEEVGEFLFRIDRMMQSLERSGRLRTLRAVVVGHFTDMMGGERFGVEDPCEVLDAYLRPLGIPVIYGFPAGHEDPNLSLYLGREVTVSVGTQGASLLFR